MPSREPVQVLEGRKFRFTRHAQDRALEMKVKAADVHHALTRPTKVVESNANPGVSYWTYGAVTIVAAWDELEVGVVCVRTILWSSESKWANWSATNPDSDRKKRDRHDWNVPQEAYA